MCTKIDLQIIRRQYTRTVHKDIRSLVELEMSFLDVKAQWLQVIIDVLHACPHSSEFTEWEEEAYKVDWQSNMSKLSAIISQLKAIKSELLVHLSKNRVNTLQDINDNWHNSDDDASKKIIELCNCSYPKQERHCLSCTEEKKFFAKLIGVSNNTSFYEHQIKPLKNVNLTSAKGDEVEERKRVLEHLTQRVWVWSICLSLVSADLDLLSGSLGFALELFSTCTSVSHEVASFFLMPTINVAKDGNISNETSAKVINNNFDNSNNSTNDKSEFTDMSSTLHEGWKYEYTSRSFSSYMLCDELFVKSCALIYNTLTRNYTRASADIIDWVDNKTEEINNNTETVSQIVDKEVVMENYSNIDTCYCEYHSSQESPIISFHLDVHKCAKWLINDEMDQVNALLWYRMNQYITNSGDKTICNNKDNNDATRVECDFQAKNVECCFYFLLLLLVRLLSEHFLRRRMCEENYSNCFRPILSMSTSDMSDKGHTRTLSSVFSTLAHKQNTLETKYPNDDKNKLPLNSLFTILQEFQLSFVEPISVPWPIP